MDKFATISRKNLIATGLLIVVFLLMYIWLSLILVYRNHELPIPSSLIERARNNPSDRVLADLQEIKHTMIPPIGVRIENAISQADDLLKKPQNAESYFHPKMLGDLDYASFLEPRIYLQAYRSSKNTKYLDAALRFTLEFADFDAEKWLPYKHLWTDQAIASRASTLSSLWLHFRSSQLFNNNQAEVLLSLVKRDLHKLSEKRLYTFNTNHGTQQNLGLIHLAIAFPDLAHPQEQLRRAIERHDAHLNYLFNDEGFVLEHSVGYHKLGTELLAVALKYLDIANVDTPDHWISKYKLARTNLETFIDASGSLPRIGDAIDLPLPPQLQLPLREKNALPSQSSYPLHAAVNPLNQSTKLSQPRFSTPEDSFNLWPHAGWLVDWSTDTQDTSVKNRTTLSWGYFPDRAHAHSNELGFSIWRDGQRWFTSIGYWPLHRLDRTEAVGWNSSNAPHLENEKPDAKRQTSVKKYGQHADVTFVELERNSADGFNVSRQLLQLDGNTWIVNDWYNNRANNRIETLWLLDPDIEAQATQINKNNLFKATFVDQKSPQTMLVSFFGTDQPSDFELLSPENDRRAVFIAREFLVNPTTAVRLLSPHDSEWALNLSNISSQKTDAANTVKIGAVEQLSSTQWSIEFYRNGERVSVERNSNQITVNKPKHSTTVKLKDVTYFSEMKTAQSLTEIKDRNRYNINNSDAVISRIKLSNFVVGLLVLQELVLGLIALANRFSTHLFRLITIPGWLIVSIVILDLLHKNTITL